MGTRTVWPTQCLGESLVPVAMLYAMPPLLKIMTCLIRARNSCAV